MKYLRNALLVFCLLLAQAGAVGHATEHLRDGDGDWHALHACAHCLAAHGLDAPLTAGAAASMGRPARHELPPAPLWRTADIAVVFRPARAPPTA